MVWKTIHRQENNDLLLQSSVLQSRLQRTHPGTQTRIKENAGTATVTITLKGNYQGTTNNTFKIVPGAVKKLTVKNNSRQKAKVNWKKLKNIFGTKRKPNGKSVW
jgi:hypothetical protein